MTREQWVAICRQEHVNPATVEPCWFHPNRPNNQTGYCECSVDGHREYVHIFAYRLFKGEYPTGFHIDHTCNPRDGTKTNRSCCNPAHLEAVTPRQNVGRAEPAQRTHCPNGHAYTPENTKVVSKQCGKYFKVMRECVLCRKGWMQKINQKRREDPAYKEKHRGYVRAYKARNKEKVAGINREAQRRYNQRKKNELAALRALVAQNGLQLPPPA